MKQEYSIELIEEHYSVNFYSIKMKDEERQSWRPSLRNSA